MRSLALLMLPLMLLSTSCGGDQKPPTVEPPPRIVVIGPEEIFCDLSGTPAPKPKPDFERPVVGPERTSLRNEDYQAQVAALAAWRRRAERFDYCWRLYEASIHADDQLTSADAGVE
jgi:hypothetical protein